MVDGVAIGPEGERIAIEVKSFSDDAVRAMLRSLDGGLQSSGLGDDSTSRKVQLCLFLSGPVRAAILYAIPCRATYRSAQYDIHHQSEYDSEQQGD